MSSLVNKFKDALVPDPEDQARHHTIPPTEPRTHHVHDDTTTTTTGAHNTLGGSDNYTYNYGANRGLEGPATHTDGPHSSNVLNKLDPRVDSDRDHSKNMGMNPHGDATTGTGANTTHGTNTRGTHIGATGTTASTLRDTGINRGVDGPATRTDGPHSSNLLNQLDPRVDSDRDHSKNMGLNPHGDATTGSTTTTHGTHAHGTHTHGTHVGATGTTGSILGNTGVNRGLDGPATRTDGPHNSNLLNKMDPRVDSDRDHSKNMGINPRGDAITGTSTTAHGTHAHGTHTHGTHVGATGTTGSTFGNTGVNRGLDGPATRTDGPHNSNLLNKMDPRIDSDRDHSRNMGANPHGTATTGTTTNTTTHGTHTHGTHAHGTHAHGTTAVTGSALGDAGANRGLDGPATRTDGPHNSNLLNKVDPRVDSDRDHSRNMGANPHGTATTGTSGTHTTHTTHGGDTGFGPGPAPNTAGPHKSDLLNKLDPRVDSDLDGSKTIGGNQTYARP